ncbi:MAG: hypothetical protein U0360_09795 [Dehalococcoidia bacterium]
MVLHISGGVHADDAGFEQDVRRAHHELRSPVALIVTAARAAIEQGDAARAFAALELIERTALRALDRITAVLEAPLPAAAHQPAEFLRHLVSDAVACGRAMELLVDPQADGEQALLDPRAFEAVAQNLVDNAFAHGDPSEPVRLHLGRDDSALHLTIRNRRASQPVAGHGIGLPLAFELVARQRGDLSAGPLGDDYRAELVVPILATAAQEG